MKVNILELNGINPTPFSNDALVPLTNYLQENGYFLRDEITGYVGTVNLTKVIGQDQVWDDFTWGEALEGVNCDRMAKRLKQLADNHVYYSNEMEYEHMSFIEIEGKYFISTGKHRTVIARFFKHFNDLGCSIGKVDVTRKLLDYDFMEYHRKVSELSKQYPDIRFDLTHVTGHDDPCLVVQSKTNSNLIAQLYKRSEVRGYLDIISKPSLLKKLWGHPSHYFIPFSQCKLTNL